MAAAASIVCSAQDGGQWRAHPKYVGSGTQNFIDAGDVAYLQCSNNLFAFDKSTLEVTILNRERGINDITVTGLYHNYAPGTDYTVVTYNTSNIDVIHADGTITNIPDIKDAVYNGPKAINDITFCNGQMVVATQFGLIFIDEKTLQVTDTYYYNRNITSAMMLGNILVVASNDEIYYDTRKNHDDFNRFVHTDMYPTDPHFYPISSEKFFMRSAEELNIVTLEMTDEINVEVALVAAGMVNNIQPTPTGYIANFMSQGFYYTFDHNGDAATKVSAAKELYSCYPAGDGTKWAAGPNGVHLYGKTPYYIPEGVGITANAYYSSYNPGDGKVYVCRTTDNAILDKANSQPSAAKTEIWSYDGKNWKDASPVGRPSDTGNYWLVFEPDQPSSYFYSTRTKNIVHVVNDTVKQINTTTNSPITFMNALALDNDGNLWGVQSFRAIDYGGKYNPYVIILPKDKFNEAPAMENWITPNITGRTGDNKRSTLAFSKGSNIAVFSIGGYMKQIYVWDMEGDLNNPSPKAIEFTQVPTDDGSNFAWTNLRCLASDSVGNIWAGADHGLFYFDPTKAWDANFQANCIRIKMGTDTESDRFLEGEDVYCISVDNLNRKWIGTKSQGAYLLSADNKTVLAQFDMSNSALPSNTIYSICPKPNTNSVIFVTSEGIAEYFFEAPVLIENYDNVQAYPNPLRPDITGFATITGLVKNSVVKITDRKGNIVATMQTTGTTAKWDGCNAAGERLATGVYNVYAGTSEETLTTTPVTQIRIIK